MLEPTTSSESKLLRGVRGGFVSAGTHPAADVSSPTNVNLPVDDVSSLAASSVQSTIYGPVTAGSPSVTSPQSAVSSLPSPSVTLAGGVGLDLSDSLVATLSLSPVVTSSAPDQDVTARPSRRSGRRPRPHAVQ